MKISKASNEFANRVYRMCTENGTLNEEKLSRSISFLSENRPNDYRGVLMALRKLVRLDVDERTVYVESAINLSAEETERVKTSITKKHGENLLFNFRTNPELIGGMKVRVGSQVYDGSVLSKINRLANSL